MSYYEPLGRAYSYFYNFEHPYYLDIETGQVVLDMDEVYTGEPGRQTIRCAQ